MVCEMQIHFLENIVRSKSIISELHYAGVDFVLKLLLFLEQYHLSKGRINMEGFGIHSNFACAVF